MSAAYRSHGRGTLMLKGTFAGVHIERASGTHDPKRLKDLVAMCRTLADKGRLDILESLAQPRGLRPLDVWRHSGDWSRVPGPEHADALERAWRAWLPLVPGERHRRDLAYALTRLLALAGPRPTVAALPGLVRLARTQLGDRGRQFNKLRDAASAFLKQTLGRSHALYHAVRDIEPLTPTRRYVGHPQPLPAARMIAAALGGEAGRLWWLMCCTGMGPTELWRDTFALEDGHLRIRGRKRRARTRLVPLVPGVDVAPPALTANAFRLRLARAGLGVTPYDGRRTFARWMEEARLLESHQQAYLGHRKTIIDLYRRPEMVVEILDADAAALAAFGGITGGTGMGRPPETPVSRVGLEPTTYGLKDSRSPTRKPNPHHDDKGR